MQTLSKAALISAAGILASLGSVSNVALGSDLPCIFERILDREALPAESYDIAVRDGIAYIAGGTSGIQIYDVSNPNSMIPLGEVDTNGICRGISISGDYAYIAADSAGLIVVDISDPTNPTVVGSRGTPGIAFAVEVQDGLAYIADWQAGLSILDVSVPATPSLVGGYDTAGRTSGVALMGTHAVLADRTGGLVIVDVADPSSPIAMGTIPDYDFGDVAIDGGRAVAITTTIAGVTINNVCNLDLSDPYAPFVAGERPLSHPFLRYSASSTDRVELHDERVIVSHMNRGLRVFDFRDDGGFEDIYAYNTNGKLHSTSYVAESGIAFAVDSAEGLIAINVAGEDSPLIEHGAFTTNGIMTETLANDQYLLACTGEGYWLYSNLDAQDPIFLGVYEDTIWGPLERAVIGNYLFQFGSEIYYLQDLRAPVNSSYGDMVEYDLLSEEFRVINGKVYTTARDNAGIIDVSDPYNPVVLSRVDAEEDTTFLNFAAEGDMMYIAVEDEGIRAYDFSDLAQPALVGSVPMDFDATLIHDMQVTGGFVFIPGTEVDGLRVIDFTDPQTAFVDPQLSVAESSPRLFETEGSVYVYRTEENVDLMDEFDVYSLGDHDRPVLSGYLNTMSEVVSFTNGMYYGRMFGSGELIDLRACGDRCNLDLNNDGMLNFFDISAFITGFAENDPATDFNRDGSWDFFDVSAYLNAYTNGCP